MEIVKNVEGQKLTVALAGSLDTMSAPVLEAELKESIDGITELVFDFEKLESVSSAGLRVILATRKVMNIQGKMVIKNVDDSVRETFEITGFVDILTIE